MSNTPNEPKPLSMTEVLRARMARLWCATEAAPEGPEPETVVEVIVDDLIDMAINGDNESRLAAIREIFDRIDGPVTSEAIFQAQPPSAPNFYRHAGT